MDWIKALTKMGVSESDAISFIEYHKTNIDIWKAYEAEAFRLIALGAERLGSKAIFENLRTNPELKKVGQFKVCNDYTPHYARVFVIKYPQYKDKFVFKSCKQSLAEVVPLGQVAFQY